MGSKQSKDDDNDVCSSFEINPEEDWPWVWAIRDASYLDWKLGFASSEDIQIRALQQQKLPVKILDNLYLGNANSVEDLKKLKMLGITAVLNMAGPMALHSKTIKKYKQCNISYKRIDAEDEPDYPLLQKHWKEAYNFIKEETTSTTNNMSGSGEGKCVVHCIAGMNRSVLIVAAYYMLKMNNNVLDTIKHIRLQRGNVASQNEGFQEQLVAMARYHNLLGPKPGTIESFIKALPPPLQSNYLDERKKEKKENPLDRLT